MTAMEREHALRYDPTYLLYGGGASFVVTIVIFRFVAPGLSRLITSKYESMLKSEQGDWNDRLLSNVNAIVSVTFSFYALIYEEGMHEDVVWHDSFFARLACAVIVGYMFGDILVMWVWCEVKKSDILGYMFHHAATVYAYYFISAYGVLCYFGMLRLIAEMSTPFVNQRWIFDKLATPRSRIYVILNGVLMVLTFFLFRICTMPIYWYQIWQVTGTEAVTKLGHIQLIMYGPCFVLDALNIFWFYKMCKGFVKAVNALRKSKDDTAIKAKSV